MLAQRILSAAILVPLVAWVVYLGGTWFFVTVLFLALLAGYEFHQMMRRGGHCPSLPLSFSFICFLLLDARYPSLQLTRPVVAFFILVSLSWELVRWQWLGQHESNPLFDWALTLGGGLYLGWTLAHFVLLRGKPQGLYWMALALLTTWAADTGAYFIGLKLGRRRLAPRLSPSKTWEGTLGGWLCGIAVALLLGIPLDLPWFHGLALGLLISTAAPFGDLAVSMMKRQVGVKDSGALIPGHGGMLDRLDSLLFTVVVVYHYVTLVLGV